jgi:predicted NBD/HSP70 family sugar kinase
MTARDRVVQYLWRSGPAVRADVVNGTALSRATVSRLVGEMQADGVVIELPSPKTPRAGRPSTLLAIEPSLGTVGGIDFGHASVRVAVADLAGTILAESRHELDVDHEPDQAIDTAARELRGLGRRRPPLLAVGAAISAPVRRDTGAVVIDGILPGWSDVELRAELESRVGTPVRVGNDANLGALAEVRAGAGRGARNVLYLMLSSGIGAGLVLDGELHSGRSGITGELGHVVVQAGGRRCRCGRRGCLETVAGAGHVERTPDGLTAAGRAVGRVAGTACNLINPERVIVGGELSVGGTPLIQGVRDGLDESALAAVARDVTVVAAQLGDRAELEGAVGLALGQADVGRLAA